MHMNQKLEVLPAQVCLTVGSGINMGEDVLFHMFVLVGSTNSEINLTFGDRIESGIHICML